MRADGVIAPAVDPPESERALLGRARTLAGLTLAELAERLATPLPPSLARAKGFIGGLVERALGASAGSRAEPDFPALGVELKTIPLHPDGRPRESTFVCSIELLDVADTEWEASRVYRKLARVLWVPLEHRPGLALGERRIGTPWLWSPSHEEQDALKRDWEEIVGRIGCGHTESLTAHVGQCLQVRPKAAHGAVRRRGLTADGWVDTLPRGFYLRARFTHGIVQRAHV